MIKALKQMMYKHFLKKMFKKVHVFTETCRCLCKISMMSILYNIFGKKQHKTLSKILNQRIDTCSSLWTQTKISLLSLKHSSFWIPVFVTQM
jgi:hypothetical protein